MNMNDEYMTCPVGIKNAQDISHTQESLKMAMTRMEEKLDDLKADVHSGFSNVDNRLEKLEQRINTYEESLPNKIDERIEQNNKNRIFDLIKWIVVTIGGSVLVIYLGNLLTK